MVHTSYLALTHFWFILSLCNQLLVDSLNYFATIHYCDSSCKPWTNRYRYSLSLFVEPPTIIVRSFNLQLILLLAHTWTLILTDIVFHSQTLILTNRLVHSPLMELSNTVIRSHLIELSWLFTRSQSLKLTEVFTRSTLSITIVTFNSYIAHGTSILVIQSSAWDLQI